MRKRCCGIPIAMWFLVRAENLEYNDRKLVRNLARVLRLQSLGLSEAKWLMSLNSLKIQIQVIWCISFLSMCSMLLSRQVIKRSQFSTHFKCLATGRATKKTWEHLFDYFQDYNELNDFIFQEKCLNPIIVLICCHPTSTVFVCQQHHPVRFLVVFPSTQLDAPRPSAWHFLSHHSTSLPGGTSLFPVDTSVLPSASW